MTLRSRDFESRASASSTTPALSGSVRPGGLEECPANYLYTLEGGENQQLLLVYVFPLLCRRDFETGVIAASGEG